MHYPDEDSHAPTAQEANTLSEYLREAANLQAELVAAEERVKHVKKQLAYYVTDLIPGYCRETGQVPGTVDGKPWKVEDKLSVSQPVETRGTFHAWLEEHGHGNMIKRAIEVPMGKVPPEEVERVFSLLAEAGYANATASTKVEASTASRWVRERYKNKEDVPEHLLCINHNYKVKF